MKNYTKAEMREWGRQYRRAVTKEIAAKVGVTIGYTIAGACGVLVAVGVLQALLSLLA